MERNFRALLWTLALTGLLLDQVSKYAVFHWLSGGPGHAWQLFGSEEEGGFRIIAQYEPDGEGGWKPHVNHGALFGFLRHFQKWANNGFAIISLIAAAAIAYWSMQRTTARDPWLCAALGLILAGTLGNFYDRLVFHGVRDFLHWSYLFDWPVFNLADCCLVTGAGLLLLQAFASGSTAPTDKNAASRVPAATSEAVAAGRSS